MAWYAVDAIDDAIEATKTLLLPSIAGTWLRLAIVAAFLGSAGGGNGAVNAANVAADLGTVPSPELTAAVVVVLVAALLVLLAYELVGAVVEFVYLDALSGDDVRLATPFRRQWRAGVRLFAFRLGVTLVLALALGTVGVAGYLAVDGGASTRIVVAGSGLIGLFVVLAGALVDGFTRAFVVPVMLVEESGVLKGWRTFWPTLVADWRQYAVYLLLGALLRLVVGTVYGFVTLAVAAVTAVPFAVGGSVVVAYALTSAARGSPAVVAALTVLLVLYVLVALAALVLARVPFDAYLRYYDLLVLGDSNAAFDLIADLRADVRT